MYKDATKNLVYVLDAARRVKFVDEQTGLINTAAGINDELNYSMMCYAMI